MRAIGAKSTTMTVNTAKSAIDVVVTIFNIQCPFIHSITLSSSCCS